MTKRGKWVRALVVALLPALVVGRWLAVTTADRLWADSLGVGGPHAQIAHMRFVLTTLTFAAATAWSLGNLYFVFRTIRSVHVPRKVGNIEILEAVPRRYLGVGVAVIGIIIALFLSYGAADWWYAKLLSSGSTDLGIAEPVLDHDLSYYLFQLPWQRTIAGFATLATSTILAAATVLYGAMGALRWAGRRLWVSDLARTHLGILLVAFALAMYWGYRLEPAEYVAGVRGVPFDSILLDVRIPVSHLLSWLALLAAGASLLWIWLSRVFVVLTAWLTLVLVSLVGHYAIPAFAHAVRSPDELRVDELERAQRQFLSVAYGLPANPITLSLPAAPDPGALSNHVREMTKAIVWDRFAINGFLNKGPAARSQTRFSRPSLGVYRSAIGDAVPVFLAVRTIDLTEARRAVGDLSWEQVHVEPYAFGSGVVAVQAGGASGEGFPLFIPDLAAPDSTRAGASELSLQKSEVLFAPGVTEYAVVDDDSDQRAGVRAPGLWNRVALAWTLQSLQIIRSREVRGGARILWKRDVSERLSALAPFAVFGEPHPAVVENRLLWVADGYAYSDESPLSPRVEWIGRTTGYVRAGLVGVVDAWSGESTVVLSPWADPLTKTWSDLLPGLIQSPQTLPPELWEHLQYPRGLFNLQAGLLEAAARSASSESGRLAGRRLQGVLSSRATTYSWFGSGPTDSVPRLRLRAALEAGEPPVLVGFAEGWVHGGVPRIEVFRLDSPTTLPGPSQVSAHLSNARLSPMVVGGTIRTVPWSDGVLFMQASYEESEVDRPPRLADVAVAWGDVVESGNNLDDAARKVLRSATDRDQASASWMEARRWFERLDEARRRGDWIAFGQAYQNLKRLLTSDDDSLP
jgi:uncharacterized membrane protein (UPF0182 family)